MHMLVVIKLLFWMQNNAVGYSSFLCLDFVLFWDIDYVFNIS